MRDRGIRPIILAMVVSLVSCVPAVRTDEASDAWSLVLATGGRQGVYYQYGLALAQGIEQRHPAGSVSVRSTSGSGENLNLLRRRRADCAFVAGDAAATGTAARDGDSGDGEIGGDRAVAAVARLYDDYLHLVVRRDSGIRGVTDLPGRRISLGPPDSGTFLMVDRLLRIAGVPAASLQARPWGIDDSLAALAAGGLDGFFWSGGVPTQGVEKLADSTAIDLVELDRYVPELRSIYDGGYRSAVIPLGRYGLAGNVGTLAVPNVMVCGTDVPAEVVGILLDALVSGREVMSRSVPQAAALDIRSAITTDPLPLHPGARDWYRATKP